MSEQYANRQQVQAPDLPLVIVGSGLAGYTLVREFRKLDAEHPIILITQSDGSFYPKPQLSAALGNQKSADQLVMKSAAEMADSLGIEIRTQERVLSIDSNRKCLHLTQEEIPFGRLVLAMGAEPRELKEAKKAISVNQLADYRRFRETLTQASGVTIIGTGLVGCEFAYDLARSGHSVRLWGAEDRILQRFLPEEPARALGKALEDLGVQISTASKQPLADMVSEAQATNRMLLTSIGLEVDKRLAETAGLRCRRGICVDQRFQTSVSDIFAIGDCAEVGNTLYQYIQPITSQARTLAQILSGTDKHWETDWWPVTIKLPGNPMIFMPPAGAQGSWEQEGSALDLKGVFVDDNGKASGAYLLGQRVKERASILALLKEQQTA